MVWDQGHWKPLGDPMDDYQQGKLKFTLFGEKLTGKWMLLRTGGQQNHRQWLLFKERDDAARPLTQADVLVEMPTSVLTGRGLEEIAADRDKAWSASAKKAAKKRPAKRKAAEPVAVVIDTERKHIKADGVRLTHPKKILYPEQGITKLDLARFYIAISEWILPHITNRPLVLVRCPDGCDRHCFYQKHPVVGTPATLRRIPVRQDDGTKEYIVVDDVAALASLVQIAALELHTWGSRADNLERPDRLIFDLDPDSTVPWKDTVKCAHAVRQFLTDLELESFVKTTGGKGLHLQGKRITLRKFCRFGILNSEKEVERPPVLQRTVANNDKTQKTGQYVKLPPPRFSMSRHYSALSDESYVHAANLSKRFHRR